MTTNAYDVVDTRTDKVVYSCNSSREAYDVADRKDRAYGAVRYRVVRDYEVMSAEEFVQFITSVREAA